MKTGGIVAFTAIVGGAMLFFHGLGSRAPDSQRFTTEFIPFGEPVSKTRVDILTNLTAEREAAERLHAIEVADMLARAERDRQAKAAWEAAAAAEQKAALTWKSPLTGPAPQISYIAAPPTPVNPIPTQVQLINGQAYYYGMPL